MPYDADNNFDFMLASADAWYSVPELMEVLMSVRRGNFTTQAGRDQALMRVNTLTSTAPFAVNRRFTQGRWYIRETEGDWALKFTQLRSALQHRGGREDRSTEAVAADRNAAGADAVRAAYAVVDRMLQEIRNRDGLYDRILFENRMRVTWTDGPGGLPPP